MSSLQAASRKSDAATRCLCGARRALQAFQLDEEDLVRLLGQRIYTYRWYSVLNRTNVKQIKNV